MGQIIFLQSLGLKGRSKFLFHFSMSLFVFLLSDCTDPSPALHQHQLFSSLSQARRGVWLFGWMLLHPNPWGWEEGLCTPSQGSAEPFSRTWSTQSYTLHRASAVTTPSSSSSSLLLLLHQSCYAHPERLSSWELNILSSNLFSTTSVLLGLWLHIHRVPISIAGCQEQS